MNHARSEMRLAAVGDGTLYAVGGNNPGMVAPVEQYNPATETWTLRANMPTPRIQLGLALATNGKLYAIGGNTSPGAPAISSANEEYNPASNSWAIKKPLPTPRTNFAAAAAPNGKIYVFGGYDGSNILKTVDEYDPATDTWTNCAPRAPCAPMRDARYRHSAATAADGKIYVVGGVNGLTGAVALKTVEVYDPASNAWTTATDLPEPNGDFSLAAGGGRLFIVGGSDSTSGSRNKVYEYVDNAWQPRAPLSTGRRGLGAAIATSGKLYAVGGVGAAGVAVKTTEEATVGSAITQAVIGGSRTAGVADLALPAVVYSHSAQVQSGTMALTADDSSGSGVGWNVTIAVSPFVYSGAATDGQSIPAVNFALTSADVPVRTAGQAVDATGGPKVVTATGTLDTPRKVLQAAPTFGSGTYTQALGVALTIPPDSRVGTYTGTLYTDIAAAP